MRKNGCINNKRFYTPGHSVTKIASFLLVIAMASACKKTAAPVSLDSSKQQTFYNQAYGSDPAQTMDVYLPAGRTTTSTKVMVMVHGGSWDGGDKTDFNGAVAALQAQLPDYSFFNINYRLSANGKNTYPAAANDVNAAVAYINGHAGAYNVDTQKMVLAGASAGAQLALLQAYTQNASGSVKATVDLFGPVDLYWLWFNYPFPQLAWPILVNFMGTGANADSLLYAQASPINYISSSTPPTIIFHGTADDEVPVQESQQLQAKLQLYNVANSLVIYPQEGHGWTDANLTDTYNKIVAFLNQYVE